MAKQEPTRHEIRWVTTLPTWFSKVMYTKIKAPDSLTARHLADNVLGNLEQLLRQVGTLNLFVRDYHTHYYSFSKELCRLAILFEGSIQRCNGSLTSTGLELAKTMQTIAQNIEKQTNKNLVGLKSIGSQRDENIHSVIADKLSKLDARLRHYESLSKELHTLECRYACKAERFADIETDTVKYYSFNFFNHKFHKIQVMQVELQKLLDKLKQERLEIQFGGKEIKKLMNELVGVLIRKIREIAKIAKLIIGKAIDFEPIIVEESSQDELTTVSQEFRAPDERIMVDYCSQYLQRLTNSYAVGQAVRDATVSFFTNVTGLLNGHHQAIMNLQRNSYLVALQKGKFAIDAILGQKIFGQFCQAQTEVFRYDAFIQKMVSRIDRVKVLSEFNLIQKMNFQEFVRQFQMVFANYRSARQQYATHNLQQAYEVQQTQRVLSDRAFGELKMLVSRFTIKEENLNSKFRLECQNMLNGLRELFKEYGMEYHIQLLSRPVSIQESQILKIYERRYFDSFIDPFINHEGDYRLETSKHIETYLRLRREADAEADDQMNSRALPERDTFFKRCCGVIGIRSKSPVPDDGTIEDFNCALAYGILLQGKLYAHRKTLKFVSIFNRKTFFGRTELEIPKRDILQVNSLSSSINYYVSIQTKHGELKFTSFISNPVGLFRDLYVEGKQFAAKKWSQPTNAAQIRQVEDRLVEALQFQRFSVTTADTYVREISSFVCYGIIERTRQTLIVTFDYKPIEGTKSQPERYMLKVTKKQKSLRCEVEDTSPVSNDTRSMKDHFLGIVKNVLQPYEHSKHISEQHLSKNKSFVVELETLETPRQMRQRTASEPIATNLFALPTEASTIVPTPKGSKQLNPSLLPATQSITFKQIGQVRSSSNLILVSDRDQPRSSQLIKPQTAPGMSNTSSVREEVTAAFNNLFPTNKAPPAVVSQPPSTSNNFLLYVGLLFALILLVIVF